MIVNEKQKLHELIRFIQNHPSAKIIVYFLTCDSVDFYGKILPLLLFRKNNYDTTVIPNDVHQLFALHGKMVQNKRERTYQSFLNCNTGAVLLW